MIIRYLLIVFFVFINIAFSTSNVNNDLYEGKCKTNYRIKKIVLDAGHGGNDSGCKNNDITEKTITLKIVKKIGELIAEKYPDIDIVYTRKKDVFVPLFERSDIANNAKADLFISIHCNAMPNPKKNGHIFGTETYTLGLHKVESNLEVAKRENNSILLEKDYLKNYNGYDPNSPLSHILLSQFQRGFMGQSIKFAELVESKFSAVAKRKSKGVKQAGFLVLHQTAMPSVLIETGFLSNEEECQFLASDDGQLTIANSIVKSFVAYKNKMEENENGEEESIADAPKVKKTEKIDKKDKADKKSESLVINRTYRIQIAALSKKPDLNSKKWSEIEKVQVEMEKGLFKCYSMDYENYSDAKAEINRLKNIGFKDVFLVIYENGKKLF